MEDSIGGGLAAAAMNAGGKGDDSAKAEFAPPDAETMLEDVGADLMQSIKSGDAQTFTENMRAFVDLVNSSSPIA